MNQIPQKSSALIGNRLGMIRSGLEPEGDGYLKLVKGAVA